MARREKKPLERRDTDCQAQQLFLALLRSTTARLNCALSPRNIGAHDEGPVRELLKLVVCDVSPSGNRHPPNGERGPCVTQKNKPLGQLQDTKTCLFHLFFLLWTLSLATNLNSTESH